MNLPYLVPRVIRHFLPESVARFLLRRSVLIKPGLETADPAAAVERYSRALASRHTTLNGKRVLVFGYGGHYDIGISLLEADAAYIVLCERQAPEEDAHNRRLLGQYPQYLELRDGEVRPRLQRLMVLQGDIRQSSGEAALPAMDLVFSNSVLEHVDDVEGSVSTLTRLTDPHGLHVHFVDLRDHFFKYPFEMLRFSEPSWRRWLNPSSNHNRLRLWEYRRIFERCFDQVEIEVLQRDEPAFEKGKARIRPEFHSGNLQEDAATLIQIVAARPRG
jgi:SAM-dependent methyltransferase